MRLYKTLFAAALFATTLPLFSQVEANVAQTPAAATAPTAVPALVPYDAIAETGEGKPLTGEKSFTFLLFKDQAGGDPLWVESQQVIPDGTGHYKVQLGAGSPSGLPLTVFASGEARGLEVQIAGQKPQARTLLTSVPYAAKSADAATLGGMPPSAFVLAGTQTATAASSSISPDAGSTVTTTGGTLNSIPIFTGAALAAQTTGSQNTAVGAAALNLDTTGGANTTVGYAAGVSSGALTNATAIGANAVVSQSNSLVLGNTIAGSPGAQYVNVGIGTDTPSTILEAAISAPGTLGPTFKLNNLGGTNGTSASVDFNTSASVSSGTDPSSRIMAVRDGFYGDDLQFISRVNISNEGQVGPYLQTNMVIAADGQVTIGPPGGVSSSANLVVNGASGNEYAAAGLPGILSQGGSFFAGYEGHYSATGGDGGEFLGGESGGETPPANGTDGGRFFGGSTEGSSENGITYVGGDGIYAEPGQGSSPGNAATLDGNVSVTGTLNAATNDFKIDHPLDPANRYLVHSSVESSEMMNIYTGNVVTDDLGIATVTLPAWFETINTDFRYQLTVIGQFAQAIIKDKIADGKFRIMTNAEHVEVSWQVTAIRQDAYAKAHPLVVDQEKPARERGFYLHPELFGKSAEKTIEWGHHPDQMRRMKLFRESNKIAPSVVRERRDRSGIVKRITGD